MAELGAGGGSGYPGAIDTDTTQESTSTTARADVPNDLAAAIIAVQAELGINPAGSVATVVAFLQTEHSADGTHSAINASSLAVSGTTVLTGNTVVGTGTADGTLHVRTTDATVGAPDATADDFIIENNGHAGASILSPDASTSNINFGSPSDTVGAIVSWSHDGDAFSIGSHKVGASLRLVSGNNVLGITLDSSQNTLFAGDVGITGAMTASTWPSFSVHKGGTNQTTITGTEKVVWSTEDFDTNSDFASNRFTPTVAGKYLLTCYIQWTSYTADDQLVLSLFKNGTVYRGTSTLASSTDSDGNTLTAIVDANGSTDYFEMFARNVARDTSNIAAGVAPNLSQFAGSRIA